MPGLAWLEQQEDFDKGKTLWQNQPLVVLCSFNEVKLKSTLFPLLKFIKILIFWTSHYFTTSALIYSLL